MMTSWMRVADFGFTLPDRPGELASLAARLRLADVNLIGLWGSGAGGGDREAQFHCVPESADQFRNFADSAELQVCEGQAYVVRGPAGSAAIVETLERIASADINLVAIQGIEQAGGFGCLIWTEPADWTRLEHALG